MTKGIPPDSKTLQEKQAESTPREREILAKYPRRGDAVKRIAELEHQVNQQEDLVRHIAASEERIVELGDEITQLSYALSNEILQRQAGQAQLALGKKLAKEFIDATDKYYSYHDFRKAANAALRKWAEGE